MKLATSGWMHFYRVMYDEKKYTSTENFTWITYIYNDIQFLRFLESLSWVQFSSVQDLMDCYFQIVKEYI